VNLNLVNVNNEIKEIHATTLKNKNFEYKVIPGNKHHVHD